MALVSINPATGEEIQTYSEYSQPRFRKYWIKQLKPKKSGQLQTPGFD